MNNRRWHRLEAAGCALLVLVLLPLVLSGCATGRAKDPRAEAVRTAVREYNHRLVRAYAMMDMNELSGVATREQAQKEFYLMSALGEGHVRMVSVLRSIEFGPVTFQGQTKASVETTETWDYKHVSLDTSATIREEHGVEYHLRYELIDQGGAWLVSSVESRDETRSSEETSP